MSEKVNHSNNWSLIPFESLGMTCEMHDILLELSSSSEYYKSCNKFVDQMTGVDIRFMTYPQQDWLYQIIASLQVENNRRIAKEVFIEKFGPSMGNGTMPNHGASYKIPHSASSGHTKFD